jgi:hypothetical protein
MTSFDETVCLRLREAFRDVRIRLTSSVQMEIDSYDLDEDWRNLLRDVYIEAKQLKFRVVTRRLDSTTFAVTRTPPLTAENIRRLLKGPRHCIRSPDLPCRLQDD